MSAYKLAFAVLTTTALAGSTLSSAGGAGTASAPGIAELLDPAAVALNTCGPIPKRRTEMFKPGFQLAVAEAAATRQATSDAPPLWDDLGALTWPVTTRSGTAQRYFDQGLKLGLRLQPRRGPPRLPRRAGGRPDLRHVLLGRGLRARPQHQLPDGARGGRARLRRDRQGAGAERRRQPKEQALIRALATRYSPDPAPTARRSTRPMPTAWPRSRRRSRTTTTSRSCSPRR